MQGFARRLALQVFDAHFEHRGTRAELRKIDHFFDPGGRGRGLELMLVDRSMILAREDAETHISPRARSFVERPPQAQPRRRRL